MMSTIRIGALVACSFALVQLVVLCQANRQQQLCIDEKIELQSIDDLHRTSTKGCYFMKNIGEAFVALTGLVEEPNVCTMDKATKIVRFYEDYLRDPDWQASQYKPRILIKKFAVAYGMHASKVCRTIMSREFYGLAANSLKASDFDAIKEWTKDDGPIARLLGSMTKGGEFLLPSDLASFTPEVVDKLKLKMTENSDKILLAQEVCEKRFRPLYEPIVMPIAYLARHGLNYDRLSQGLPIASELMTHGKHALWSRIVFVCESLKDVEVIEAPTGSTGQSDDAVAKGVAKRAEAPVKLQLVERFKPFSLINGLRVNDESSLRKAKKFPLYSLAHFRIESAITSFNVTMSETDRFREKLLSNKWGLLLATFKSNEQTKTLLKRAFGMVMNAWQRRLDQGQQLESAKKDMLELVEAKKNSTIFRALAKILKGGMIVVYALASLLQIVLVLSVVVACVATTVLDFVSAIFVPNPNLTEKLANFIDQI